MSSRITDADIDGAFELFDTDSTGRINQAELTFALKGLGFPNITKSDVVQIMKHVDKDASGTIDKTAFRSMIRDKMKNTDGPEEILAAFKLFDSNNAGKISYANLYDIAKRVNNENEPNEDILREVIKAADRDGDGEIGWEDWKYIMTWVNRTHGDVAIANRWTHFGISQTVAQSATARGRRRTSPVDEKVTTLLNNAKSYQTEAPKSITIAGTSVTLEQDGKITRASAWVAVRQLNANLDRADFDVLFQGEDSDRDDKLTLTQYKALLTALGEE